MTSTYTNKRRTPPLADNRSRAAGGSSRAKPARRPASGAAAARLAQAARLADALAALARGLANPWDESTDYFHGFVAALPANVMLSPDSLRTALGVGARYRIDLSPATEVLAKLGKSSGDLGEEIAGGFRQLAAVMTATLRELSLAFARGNGVVRVRVWLFGRTEDGTLVGLRSLSTET